jgi:molybdate transport system regulatory protein
MTPVSNPATMNRTGRDVPVGGTPGQHVCPDIVLRTKVWLEVDRQFAIGEGGVDLLSGILRCNSLAKAAREIGWSYRHAWGYLRRAERALGIPLTTSLAGKGAARGMTLTAAGRALVEHLSLARDCVRKAATELSKLSDLRRSFPH